MKEEKRPDRILKRLRADKTDIDTLLKSTKKYYDAQVENYKKFYDEDIKNADQAYREGYEKVEETLSKIVKPGEKILDAGCGVGRWSVLMAGKGALVVSIDQSREMLENCRERSRSHNVGSRIIPLHADAMALPFLDDFFDGAAVNWVIAHIPVSRNENFMREIGRVVKQGGWLVLSDSYWRGQEGGKEQLQIRESGGRKFKIYKYYYSPNELRKLIEKTFGRVQSIKTTPNELICLARRK